MRSLAATSLGIALLGLAGAAAADGRLQLTVGSITHSAFELHDVSLSWREGGAALRIARLRLFGRELTRLKLDCPGLRWEARQIDCAAGRVSGGPFHKPVKAALSVAPRSGRFEIRFAGADGQAMRISGQGRGDSQVVEIAFQGLRLEDAADWGGALGGLGLKGTMDGTVRLSGPGMRRLQAQLALTRASFSNPTGERAGDKLKLKLALDATRSAGGWAGHIDGAWDAGEIFWKPWYLADRSLAVSADFSLNAEALRFDGVDIGLDGVGTLRLAGRWQPRASALESLRFSSEIADLELAGKLLLAPLLAQSGLPALKLAGSAKAQGIWQSGTLLGLALDMDGISLGDGAGRFALKGVAGRLEWSPDKETRSRITVAKGQLWRLPLGAFEIALRLRGLRIQVDALRVPILDGELLLSDLRAEGGASGWSWQAAAALSPVSMSQLSAKLGLPRMAGSLSATIPRVAQSGANIGLDGDLEIQVFDGLLKATGLQVIEPFGRLPRLKADLALHHFDLGQLTEAFSFGDITGFIDGEVRGLELAQWRAQRFDAWIASSPGDYRKRISQRAVENITALGGASASAAIQRSFLRFFDRFGYERLGWRCVLRDGLCQMGGIDGEAKADGGYVIVKGGGLPAINVIGYNRQVDWNELLARLARITDANARPVIK